MNTFHVIFIHGLMDGKIINLNLTSGQHQIHQKIGTQPDWNFTCRKLKKIFLIELTYVFNTLVTNITILKESMASY